MKLKLLVLALLVAGISFGAYEFGVERGRKAAPPAQKSERRILYWHDPMVPGQRFDKPGKSPFMDMQLVPVYEDEQRDGQGAGGGVAVDPRMQQSLGVRTASAEKAVLTPTVEAVGSVGWNERDAAIMLVISSMLLTFDT